MIRWPWVSREAYDAMESQLLGRCGELRDSNADMRDMLIVERKRFDSLLDKFTSLRLAGASIPEPVTPREAKEIDPLKQAVLNASIGKPPSVRAAMLKQLAEDMKSVDAGLMTEMDVQRRIETGFTPDDGIPE